MIWIGQASPLNIAIPLYPETERRALRGYAQAAYVLSYKRSASASPEASLRLRSKHNASSGVANLKNAIVWFIRQCDHA